MKKILSIFIVLTFLTITLAGFTSVTANDEVFVTLDGRKLDFDVKPQIIDGRTLVPLRKIFEEIGALVKWDGETQTVSARKSSKTITMVINSADMQIDKGKTDDAGNPIIETVTLDVASQVLDGRTLVPARAISEAFGLNVEWDKNSKTVIITDDEVSDDTWKENAGTINLTDLTYTGEGVVITDNQIKITAGGDFTLKGTLADGNITVNTQDRVKIRLSGADITSSTGSPIYFEKADKAYITITDGTENSLTAQDSESDALYSKENLEIKGDGTLTISAKGGHAIKASDNLTIENGVLNLTSESDGIHINDTFKMIGGTVNISVIGDGIDSESIVIIEGGTLNIETKGTPIQTETATETTSNEQGNMRFNPFEDEVDVEFEKSSKGINAEWMMVISGGDITVKSASHAIHCQDEIEIKGGIFNIASTYDKGISAHGNLTIDGADTVIDITKSTEGIESKNVMTINDGKIDIVASDDAINATGGRSGEMMGGGGNRPQGARPQDGTMPTFDGTATQNGTSARPNRTPGINADGTQTMPNGNRGNRPNMPMNGEMPPPPENGQMPTPPDGGEMPVPPENGNIEPPEFTNGGNRPQGGGGQMGGNMKDCLIINGGIIEAVAGDDCLDANGNIVINGGIVKAIKENGTFVGMNSVLDPDGRITISENATLVLAGRGGTDGGGRGGNSGGLTLSQNAIYLYSETKNNANESIVLKDQSGNAIAEYSPKAGFSAVLIASPDIEIGESYVLSVGNETHNITVSEQNTVIGTQPTSQSGFGGRIPR